MSIYTQANTFETDRLTGSAFDDPFALAVRNADRRDKRRWWLSIAVGASLSAVALVALALAAYSASEVASLRQQLASAAAASAAPPPARFVPIRYANTCACVCAQPRLPRQHAYGEAPPRHVSLPP